MAVIRAFAELDAAPCTGCKLCDLVCPSGAITMVAKKAVIDDPLCIGCGRCVDRCPEDIMWMTERAEPITRTVLRIQLTLTPEFAWVVSGCVCVWDGDCVNGR